MNPKAVYIFWTCRHEEEASHIIRALLDRGWIACASIFPEVKSMYRWEGKIEESREAKVILKTLKKHFSAIQNYIQAHSSYEVPEILQVEISQGNPTYLDWLAQETEKV